MSSSPAPNTTNLDWAGNAYGRPAPSYRRDLTEVGPGTPMGELMRRYWHPVARSEDARDEPLALRVLGEDLVLFRDTQGRPGLLHQRCAHRGASLVYGRVEACGLRCCYHGWAFDVTGRCTEQPCEPAAGAGQRERIRQPWYPLQERYGMVWAYMGPPQKMPLLPHYEVFENLAEGEFLETDANSIGGGGPVICDFNWLQHYENVVDPFHLPVLHASFSGTQFVKEMGIMPDVRFEYGRYGVNAVSLRTLPDGRTLRRVSGVALPTLRLVGNPRLGRFERLESIGFVLPIDDHHFRIYTIGRVRAAGELLSYRSLQGGKPWRELTPEEHRRFPGDYEAQRSQGDISAHSEEHLASSDAGIGMLRRLLSQQVQAVAAGQDPLGVIFDPAQQLVHLEHGNFLLA